MKILIARVAFSVFVLLCTIQMIYWPLLMKPGTQLDWWQVRWLAQTGYVLGFGPLILSRWVGGHALVAAAFIWAVAIFFLTGLWRCAPNRSLQRTGHTTPGR